MQATAPTSTDVLALYARAIPIANRIVANVRPDQLDAPTPCTEWDVRALLNHTAGLNRALAAGAAGEPPPAQDADHLGDDPAAAFAAAANAAHAALRAPGGLERTYRLPWGDMAGMDLAPVYLADTVIHAWDLAKATGQPTALDPDLCEAVLAWGRTMMRPEFRTPASGFGPELPAPAEAPVCARLAAFYGRQP